MRRPHFVLSPLSLAAMLATGAVLALPAKAATDAAAAVAADTAAPAPSLATVTVTAGQDAANALPAAYSGGQVATGGRVGLLGNKDFMETPFNTISYTDTFIQDIQAQDIGRVISLTDPGVFTAGSSGMINDNFSVRGFSLTQGDVGFGGLYGVVPYYRMTPELAERIEVLKGPSALLNGMPPQGSVGGAVNLVPKRAGDKPLTRITTTYASDSQFGTHVDLGQRFGENKQLGVRFNGVYRDGDTAVNGQSKKATLAALGLDWRSGPVRLSADFYTSEDHVNGLNRGISLASGLSVPRPPSANTLLAPSWTFTNTKDEAVVLRGEVDIGPNTTAYASYGHSKTDFDALAGGTYQVYDAAGNYRNNFAHQRFAYQRDSAEAGMRTRFHTGSVGHEVAVSATAYQHDYYFGFRQNMLATNWVTNIYNPVWGASPGTSFSSAALPQTGAVRISSLGVADTLSFDGNRAQLTLGLRRQSVVSDTYDGTSGSRTAHYDASATTPAVALMYRVAQRLAIYGNYIEGLSQGSTAPTTAANAGAVFPPYKTKQRELGLKADIGGFAGTLSLFQIQRPSSYTDPTTNVFSFGGEQRNRGIEASVFGEALPGLRVLGGVSYTEPKLTRTAGGVNQGRLATGTPKWQAKAGVEYDIAAVRGLAITGNAVAASKQYINADNSLWVPGRTVFDLGARYSTAIANRPVVLRAGVQNVANKAYWASTLGSGLGAPRTVVLSASVDL